jgi:Xaa-Pro aminopeptidase
MLTDHGCRARRERFWSRVPGDIEWAVVTDPAHLVYFANYFPSPFVFNSQRGGAALLMGRDGTTALVADNVQQPFLDSAFAVEKIAPVWYRCVESAGRRDALLVKTLLDRIRGTEGCAFGIEQPGCPAGLAEGLRGLHSDVRITDVSGIIHELRRAKDDDEVALIRRALDAATTALHRAMTEVRPGMTELQVFELVTAAACEAAGQQVLVYGDFASGPRCVQGGGPPTLRTIESGDLVLLDFSVVLHGYRGDFANTFLCGDGPSPRQQELQNACLEAMRAGEARLRAGVPARDVFFAVRSLLAERELAPYFTHHAGHGIGLSHPEPPFIVPESSETLVAGDVVTLEPGLYLSGVGGMRFERNYLVTQEGYELLSEHHLGLTR